MLKLKLPKRKAKIICTIGPVSNSYEQIKKLALAGMDVARLNFSHSSHEEHAKVIDNIRRVSNEIGKPIGILQDLQGPKIRIGQVLNNQIELKDGQEFSITTEDVPPTETMVSTTYKDLAKDLSAGDNLLIDDGNIRFRVIESDGVKIRCTVTCGGVLKNKKGINVPDLKLSTKALTDKDIEDLMFGIANDVEYIALSFVREAKDVVELKALIREKAYKDIPIIAKIEKPQAVENIDEILAVTDGIMVARGDLGVEMQIEKMPVIQKMLIKKANEKGILVITATQMLESMIYNPGPTRAEATDVANAIFDGTDAVMLSGETASGKFPIETASMMSRIVEEAEASELYENTLKTIPFSCQNCFPQIIAEMASNAANRINAKAIISLTSGGTIVKRISKCRPKCSIISLSPFLKTQQLTSLYWGVFPVLITEQDVEEINRLSNVTQVLDERILETGVLEKGDKAVVTFGSPMRIMGETNLMKLYRIGMKNNIDGVTMD